METNLRVSYQAISLVMVNNGHYIHFSFTKISIINWLLMLIHLFQTPHASKCGWTEWNSLLCYLQYHWLIMILLFSISKNKSVLATFCIPVLQPNAIHSQPLPTPFAPPPSPQSYWVLVLELQARWKINKRNWWEKKIQISTTQSNSFCWLFDHSITSLSSYT